MNLDKTLPRRGFLHRRLEIKKIPTEKEITSECCRIIGNRPAKRGMEKPNYGSIFYFVSRYKLKYLGLVAVALPVSILEGLSIAAFFPLFSTLLSSPSNDVGGLGGFAAQVAEFLPLSSAFAASVLFLILIFVVKTIGILSRDLLMAYTGAKILYSVKKEIMERYASAEHQFMLDSQQGSLIYVGLTAPNAVSNLHLTLLKVLTSGMKVVSILTVLISLLPILAAAFIGLGLMYYLFIHYISKKVSYYLGLGRVEILSKMNVIANEFINGFRQIVAFNTINRWEASFDKENRAYSEIYAKDLAWQSIPRPLLEMAALGLLLGSVLLLKMTSPDTFAQDLAAFGVFAVALVQILPAVNVFGGSRLQIMNVLPDVEIAHQVLTQSVPARKDGHIEASTLTGDIVFKDVSFAHKGRIPLINHLNMTIERGKVTAIVGRSGSGKTTLINLILRLFEPSNGRITVGGVALQDLTHKTWMNQIGFVSQDPFITNSTIEDNIRFNRVGHNQQDIVRAAIVANADNFISEFPEGYHTVAGDRGVRLSGGQQQRICIARAVLDSPDILIFDEATSSLDSLSENEVQAAIEGASANRTVIIVAHRLSTIKHADQIIVMDNGKVVEQGTHQELLSGQSHYSRQVAASGS